MNRLLRKFSRRRPVARRAHFLTNPLAEEEENEDLPIVDFSRPPPAFNFPPAPLPDRKKSGIMQKISTWSSWWKDHLPGRTKKERRSDSETRQVHSISGPLGSSTTQREVRLFGHLDGPPAFNGALSSGEFRRPMIQTNPWFPPPSDSRTTIARNSDLLDTSYSSSLSHLTRDSLRINTLAGSYSSGYGSHASQDSSPECSVHSPSWQPSAQLLTHGRLVDKSVECRSVDLKEEMNEEHVYYELETSLLHRASAAANGDGDSCFSSEIAALDCSTSSADSSRADSPIYAIPHCSSADESRCGSIEYVDSPSFDYDCSGYARVRRVPPPPPQFHAPPPPPFSPDERCLDLLDVQIAELKMKTEMVSRLVEAAKERRELRDYARKMCFDHIDRLRNMRWFVENGFELDI